MGTSKKLALGLEQTPSFIYEPPCHMQQVFWANFDVGMML